MVVIPQYWVFALRATFVLQAVRHNRKCHAMYAVESSFAMLRFSLKYEFNANANDVILRIRLLHTLDFN